MRVHHKVKLFYNENPLRFVIITLVFIAMGLSTILLARAATNPSPIAVENENGSKTNGASSVDDAAASNGKAVNFNPPASPPVKQVKSQIRGVVDRDGYNSGAATSAKNLTIPSQFEGVVNNFVLMLNWDQLQPNNTNELNSAYIDDAIAEAKAHNMRIKMRILAGIHAPGWVKNLSGGPFAVYDIDQTTGEQFSGTSPRYWTTPVKSAYANLMAKLAAKYDSEDTLASVTNTLCTTIFGEPFIKNLDEGSNMSSFYNAGLTDALDQQCQNEAVDIHNTYWKYTRTETAVNPLSYKGVDNSGTVKERFNVDFTIAWVNRCRQVLGQRCIMGNNGFNNIVFSANYRQVLGAIVCVGNPPLYFQTRQYAAITSTGNSIDSVLAYAQRVGAGMVELPYQYKAGASTPSGLAGRDAALESNSSIACPGDRLLPNP